jgi:hypothetical protein
MVPHRGMLLTVASALLVVGPLAAQAGFTTRAYPVADLVLLGDAKQPNAAPALLRLITQLGSPLSWDFKGGPGSAQYYPLGMSIVVNQSPECHRQIAGMLSVLRLWRRITTTIWSRP